VGHVSGGGFGRDDVSAKELALAKARLRAAEIGGNYIVLDSEGRHVEGTAYECPPGAFR
jgi:hypothetical protein